MQFIRKAICEKSTPLFVSIFFNRCFELIFNIIYNINNISLNFRFGMHKENSSI